MTNPATLRKLADRVELLGAAESGRALDHEIARALRGKESVFDPQYHLRLDDARSISTWIITHASDIAADGLAMVELSDTGGPCRPVNIVRGIASTLPAALCAASLRARAMEIEEAQ